MSTLGELADEFFADTTYEQGLAKLSLVENPVYRAFLLGYHTGVWAVYESGCNI